MLNLLNMPHDLFDLSFEYFPLMGKDLHLIPLFGGDFICIFSLFTGYCFLGYINESLLVKGSLSLECELLHLEASARSYL